jgi:hypothetical protein
VADAANKDHIKELLEHKLLILKNRISYGYHGSWGPYRIRELEEDAKVDQLDYFIGVKEKYQTDIKIRLEEPTLTIYSNDLNLLYSIAAGIYPERLLYVHKPRNKEEEAVLNDGHVISTKAAHYSHKVLLKECIFKDVSIKQSIGDYLYNLGDEIQMTNSLKRYLTSIHSYFGGGYFYCKDEKILTFINLICPNFISGIYKLSEPV